jgi:hydroxypyruvate isomerase
MTAHSGLTFAANLSMLFTELPFLDRFQSAADHGFTHVEFMFPYEFNAHDIARVLQRAQQRLVLFNLYPGDWAAGERGIAALPDRREEFRSSVSQALMYADIMHCAQLHCLAGIRPGGLDDEAVTRVYRENLAFACEAAERQGVSILIEPINTVDIPGYYLNSAPAAVETIRAVNRPNLGLQYDVYHMTRMGENVLAGLAEHVDHIRHVQIADAPGRNEPGTGKTDFSTVFKRLQALNYAGAIGLEYRPKRTTAESLAWLDQKKAMPT